MLEHVPGTAPLNELGRVDREISGVDPGLLKHDASGEIVLVPQPSDSPNDPLNWSQWRKDSMLLIIGLNAAVVGAYGPMLSPGFVTVSKDLHITVEVLSQSTAWLILTIGQYTMALAKACRAVPPSTMVKPFEDPAGVRGHVL